MATLKILVPNKKNDSILVNVRITHKRQHRFINTKKYIDKQDLDNNGDVPFDWVVDYLFDDYKMYKDRLNSIPNIDSLSIDQVAKIIEHGKESVDPKYIKETTDFVAFCKERLKDFETKKSERREPGTILLYGQAVKEIAKYFGDDCKVANITRKTSKAWLEWMIDSEGLSEGTAKQNYYRIKKLYNDLMEHMNDPDDDYFVLMQNPMDAGKPKSERRKKRPLITLEEVRMIRDCQTLNFYIGRTFFMLYLYMCGANYADVYDNVEKWIENGKRAEYERRKTRNKREDFAFISINITPEVKVLLDDFIRYKALYPGKRKLNDRIAAEIKQLNKWLQIKTHIVPYTARYMFSNIASDQCDMRDDYIARAMNHRKADVSETLGYLHNHWRKIDEVQQAVIDKINEDLK